MVPNLELHELLHLALEMDTQFATSTDALEYWKVFVTNHHRPSRREAWGGLGYVWITDRVLCRVNVEPELIVRIFEMGAVK
jgi:hypothetical protein